MNWISAHWAEVLGFVSGALCVWLAARRNVATFPIGIANNLIFIGLFAHTGIYANAALQCVYLVLGVHGWLHWHRAGGVPDFVLRTPRAALPVLALVGIALGGALVWLLRNYTDSTAYYADAATTSVSLIAQYMLNRRWLETWLVWIAVDIGYVAMYLAVGLPITAMLYLLFIGLCIHGLHGWITQLRTQQSHRVSTSAKP